MEHVYYTLEQVQSTCSLGCNPSYTSPSSKQKRLERVINIEYGRHRILHLHLHSTMCWEWVFNITIWKLPNFLMNKLRNENCYQNTTTVVWSFKLNKDKISSRTVGMPTLFEWCYINKIAIMFNHTIS